MGKGFNATALLGLAAVAGIGIYYLSTNRKAQAFTDVPYNMSDATADINETIVSKSAPPQDVTVKYSGFVPNETINITPVYPNSASSNTPSTIQVGVDGSFSVTVSSDTLKLLLSLVIPEPQPSTVYVVSRVVGQTSGRVGYIVLKQIS